MRTIIALFILHALSIHTIVSQPHMDVSGSIKISNDTTIAPEPGTIRWNGNDFEGWNGVRWVSLSGHATVGTVTDIEGNVYSTARIGNQEWMTENLRTRTYANGDPIPWVIETYWPGVNFGAFCWYDDDSTAYENVYGKLYNFYAATSYKQVCPTGWRMPTPTDWEILEQHLGTFNNPGGKLKIIGFDLWNPPNIAANNESGFNAKPAGFINNTYQGEGAKTGFWSFDVADLTSVWLITENGGMHKLTSANIEVEETIGLSIRCIKDN